MIKVVTIVGARPQFVKAAVVSRAFQAVAPAVREVLVHTGQHFDANMSDVFFEEMDIPKPDHHLGVGGGTHGQNTGRMIEKIEEILLREKPDWVLVYGDTDSTLAGTLAAVKLHIPVAHVEAGLRSYNRRMPEEINRVLTDHASTLLFAPTVTAVRNLEREGVAGEKVRQVGDVMYDAVLHYAEKAAHKSDVLADLNLGPKSFVLATIHRQENTDDPARLAEILAGLAQSPLPVVWPVHPRTRMRMRDFGITVAPVIRVVDPVGYFDMVMLEKQAMLIATDSGGVQKEAYFHGVPCITLRDETEWVELIEAGANRLCPADRNVIAKLLNEPAAQFDAGGGLYGDGASGRAIVAALMAPGPGIA